MRNSCLAIMLVLILMVPISKGDASQGTMPLNFSVNSCAVFLNENDCIFYGCHWCEGECQRLSCPAYNIPSSGGGAGYITPEIVFDLKNITVRSISSDSITISFIIENKGAKSAFDIVVNQKITSLADMKVLVDDTRTVLLDERAEISSVLIPLEDFRDGTLYRYDVFVYAKDNPQENANGGMVFKYTPEKAEVLPFLPAILAEWMNWGKHALSDARVWIGIVVLLFLVLRKKEKKHARPLIVIRKSKLKF